MSDFPSVYSVLQNRTRRSVARVVASISSVSLLLLWLPAAFSSIFLHHLVPHHLANVILDLVSRSTHPPARPTQISVLTPLGGEWSSLRVGVGRWCQTIRDVAGLGARALQHGREQ